MKNLHDIAKRLSVLSDEKQIAFRKALEGKGIDSWSLPIVAYDKEAKKEQPLSASQNRFWFIDRYEQGSSLYNLNSALRLKGKLDISRLSHVIGLILQRHHILRTTYQDNDGEAFQVTHAIDDFQLVVENDDVFNGQAIDSNSTDFELWLKNIVEKEKCNIFDLTKDLPFRIRLIKINPEDYLLLFTVHHIAFDAWSQSIIIRELSTLYSYFSSDLYQKNICVQDVNMPEASGSAHDILPPLDIQYADYAIWQNQWFRGDAYQKQLSYWKTKLADAPKSLTLPFDRPRQSLNQQKHLGDERILMIPANVSLQLKTQATIENVSVYQYLLTLFKLTLHRYSGSRDLLVGTSVANRQRLELENLAGLFVNTLALRTRISENMTFSQLLKNVAKTSQEAVANQDIPFDHLLDALGIERSDTHTPLFQVLFVYINMPDQQELQLDDLRIDVLKHPATSARFELTLRVEEQADNSLCLCLEYDTDLFNEGTATQILNDYYDLCVQVFESSAELFREKSISNITLGSSRLSHQQLNVRHTHLESDPVDGFNPKQKPVHHENTALALFLAALETAHDDDAVCFDGSSGSRECMSYGDLAAVSVRAAQFLKKTKLGVGDRVGLCMSRSQELIAAMIGCWQVGAAFVVLDPTWHKDRLHQLIHTIELKLLIANDDVDMDAQHNAVSFSQFALCIQDQSAETFGGETFDGEAFDSQTIDRHVRQAIESSTHVLDSQLPAYYIFTSGSTGTPKAVVITHANLSDYVRSVLPKLNLPKKSDMASLGSLAADLGHTAVFGALLSGRCLRIFDEHISQDPEQLANCLTSRSLHCLKITPSHFRGFSDIWADLLPQELLILGGESFDVSLLQELNAVIERSASHCRLLNHYGPTETCVGVLTYEVEQKDSAANIQSHFNTLNPSVPIGKPLAHARVYVLSESLTPVPIGSVGELYIAGTSVAQGYFNQKALSAESFIPDPFSQTGERMYRSGDHVRLTHNHTIEYIGRQDSQIKIRGHRVEVGEIEHGLRQVILTCKESSADQKLTFALSDGAIVVVPTSLTPVESLTEKEKTSDGMKNPVNNTLYGVLLKSPSQCTQSVLDEHIQLIQSGMHERLTDYMQPSRYIVVDTFPRLLNGKLDRQALIEQALQRVNDNVCDASDNKDQQPDSTKEKTQNEKILCDIWKLVLNVEHVGVHDNFFTIGGDSILSLQVLAKAKKQGIKIKPKQFFDGKTVAGILNIIDSINESSSPSSSPSSAPSNSAAHASDNTKSRDQQKDHSNSQNNTENNHVCENQDDDCIRAREVVQGERNHWPLSYAQERLWWLYQFDKSATQYNLPVALLAKGTLDQAAVELSLNALIRRHEILRTVFSESKGIAVQSVLDDVSLTVPLKDYSDFSESDKQAQLQTVIDLDRKHAFNLAQAPLIRLQLVRLSKDRHVIVLNIHHICTDGWSMKLLINEFVQNYALITQEKQPISETLPIQYADYSVWQREQFDRKNMDSLGAFWQTHLEGTPATIDLPTDQPRPAQQSFKGTKYTLPWNDDLDKALANIAKPTGKTPFTIFMAVFQYCLRCYSNQQDFRIGFPVSGRHNPDTQPLIGCFVNTLVYPARTRDELSVAEFLNHVEANITSCQHNQDMPFEYLVQLLESERDLSRAPLFQVMLNFQHASLDDGHIHLPELSLSPRHQEGTSSKFDLSMDVTEHRTANAKRYSASIEYCTDIFSHVTIERFARLFTHFVTEMSNDVNRTLRALPSNALDSSSQDSSSQDSSNQDSSHVVHHMGLLESIDHFANASNSVSHLPAIIDKNGSTSYAQLNEKANQLAIYLASKGVGPEDTIAVNLPRCSTLLICLIAIQKTGASYLPLDPTHPIERRIYMLTQSRAQIVLNDDRHEPQDQLQPAQLDCQILNINDLSCLNQDVHEHGSSKSVNEKPTAHVDQLVYTIFTSGSTGKPKGVQVTRGALDNLLTSFAKELDISVADKCLALTTASFDISALEMFLPLLCGATVVLATEAERVDADALLNLVHKHDVSMIQATPTTWRMLLSATTPDSASVWPSRKKPIIALCGGEALPSALAHEFSNVPLRLINVYGPTETTIWSSSYTVKHDDASAASHDDAVDRLPEHKNGVPIGLPIANTQFYILDEQLRHVPTGAKGKLYIGGLGLARGYAQRPDLSAGVFIPNPFYDDGSRLYNTGDTVRINIDGQLEYLGRDDGQVKLRGHRIELAEIENCIAQHTDIDSAVVVIKDEQLVAYCTVKTSLTKNHTHSKLSEGVLSEASDCHGDDDDSNSFTEIKKAIVQAISESLPAYMCPQHILKIDAFPLSAAGKVDRKKLMSTALPNNVNEHTQHQKPHTPIQIALATLWQELLGVDQVHIGDNFFALGGHSLIAIQFISRAKHHPELQSYSAIDLRALFNHPTIAEFEDFLLAGLEKPLDVSEPLSPLIAKSAKENDEYFSHLAINDGKDRKFNIVPLSFQQERLWVLDKIEDGSSAYNMSIALCLTGQVDKDAIQFAYESILNRHQVLRARFITLDDSNTVAQEILPLDELDNRYINTVHFDANASDANLDSHLPLQLLESLVAIPFDLEQQSPIRLNLIKLSDNQHIIQLVIHHIASDAWSMHIAMSEFVKCYELFVSSSPALPSSALPSLALQYSDYAHWQKETLAKGQLDNELAIWKKTLKGCNSHLPIVLDYPRSKSNSYDGAAYSFHISNAQVEKLDVFAQKHGASLFMVLMSVYFLFLHKETETQDLLVGTDVANRPHPELEPLIGFFINVLPIRSQLDPQASFVDYFQGIKDTLLLAFEHQQTPFEKIVEALKIPRVDGVNPLVQTLFVMQNTPQTSRQLADLQIDLIELKPSSRFDLALFTQKVDDGLSCKWVYRKDLFAQTTIQRFAQGWQALMNQIIDNPQLSIDDYSLSQKKIKSVNKIQGVMDKTTTNIPSNSENSSDNSSLSTSKLKKMSKLKRMKTKPKGSTTTKVDNAWVKYSSLDAENSGSDAAQQSIPARTMPLVIQPAIDQLDPFHWAEKNRELIEDKYKQHGAILFRGFALKTAGDFESFAQAIYPNLYGNYGDLPKEKTGKKIYKSTPYPDNQMILFHNESSHMSRWPRRQWFFSQIVAQQGGATPIVDCREIYKQLPKSIVSEFEAKGLLYVRNFTKNLDVSWQDFFKTDSKDDVEQQCRTNGMEYEWFDEYTLQVRERAPAVISHPLTGEKSFFNQIQLHHVSCLEPQVRQDLMTMVGIKGMPRNVYYGDGTPIDDAIVQTVIDTYEALALRFQWQAGDVIMLDNMMISHARDPFSGPRKIAVAMADLHNRTDFFDDKNARQLELNTCEDNAL